MLRVACVLRTTDVHPELFGLSVHSSHTRARISIKRGCVVPFAVIVAILMVVMVVMMVMMVMLVMMILTCRVLRSTEVHPEFVDLFTSSYIEPHDQKVYSARRLQRKLVRRAYRSGNHLRHASTAGQPTRANSKQPLAFAPTIDERASRSFAQPGCRHTHSPQR